MRGLTKKSLVTLNSPPSGRRSTREGEVVGKISFHLIILCIYLPPPPFGVLLLPGGGELR